MKKNFLFGLFATAMLLLTTACQKENDLVNGNEVMVNFEVSTPEIATRAYSDGETATKLQYAVYNSSEVFLKDMFDGKGVDEKDFTLKTNVSMRLALGNEYYVLFWAEAPNAPYTVDFAGKTLTVNYDGALSNDENRDAFYCWKKVTDDDLRKASVKIEMRRPFAQLNIGTGDTKEAAASGVTAKTTAVKVKAYQAMNFSTGKVSGLQDVVFDYADVPTDEKFPVDHYDYLAMNYLLVGADKEVINEVVFQYTIAENNKIETRTFTSIPVRRNYRTNIYGNLLTQAVDFNVEIKPEYENDQLERWDGKTFDAIEADADGVYNISHAAEFAWILKEVSGDVNISLECDIDFGGFQIPEFDKTNNKTGYHVILNGNGHTIRNFKNLAPATRGAQDQIVALFDIVMSSTVKDLTIEGAVVDAGEGENAYAGILFGKTYGTITLNNVTIKDGDLKGTNKVGSLIGYAADNSKLNIENCHIIDTDVKTHDVENESGLAGGFIGYISQGNATINNSSVEGGSLKLKNATKDNKRANSAFIGAIGGSGTIMLNNCFAKPKYFSQPGGVYPYVCPYGSYPTSSYSDEIHPLIGGNRGTAKVFIDGVEVMTQDAFAQAVRVPGSIIELIAGTYAIPTDIADNVTIKGTNAVIYDMGAVTLEVDGFVIDGGVIEGNNKSQQTTLTLSGSNNTVKNVMFNKTGGNGVALCIRDNDVNSVTVVEGVNFGTEDSFRNIGWCSMKGKLHVKDCQFTDGIYNVHIDDGHDTAELVVENSTIYGLTTLANTLKKATFINCEMGFVNGYNAFWLRSDADFIDCKFAKKEASETYSSSGYGVTSANNENNTVNFNGCTYTDGTTINYLDETSTEAPLINMDSDAAMWFWYVDGHFVGGNAGDAEFVANADALKEALANGEDVILGADVKVANSEVGDNGYGAIGISQLNGGVIDGNGYSVSVDAWGTWDSAINTTGGTIKNMFVTGGMRGIFVNHNSTYSDKVILDNVTIDGTVYTISCDQGTGKGLDAVNSTFNGWTSYAATIGNVKFTDCNFGEGQGYAFCRPYAPTVFTNCDFEAGYKVDPLAAVTFVNCTFGGKALTTENIAELVTSTGKVTVK